MAEAFEVAPSLVDLLLAEQRTLRAVDEFSDWHAKRESGRARFETLIPGAKPGEGQQYAFAVDLDACTGCKACVTACHSLNGLEVGETWRKIGELESSLGSSDLAPHRQTVTTACHHCEDPACLAGCPVRAYDKDPTTGIVIHLDDQCIGCRYCQLTCPYDVPQYSSRLGIVRKCDLCHGRLAAGEAPACVQGCPNEAISIAVVDVAAAAPIGTRRETMRLPVIDGAMPPSTWTGPTTRYRTRREGMRDLRPVDGADPAPAAAHGPLAVMLVLTQAAVGTLFVDFAALGAGEPRATEPSIALVASALLGLSGLAASTLHLGRPRWAFRAFLGWRTSWMSREILVFGGFAIALVAALGASLGAGFAGRFAIELGASGAAALARLEAASRVGALATGLVGLYCSVRIYSVTGRPLWRFDRTALRFGGTALLLGLAVGAFAASVRATDAGRELDGIRGATLALSLAWLTVAASKLRLERGMFVHGTPGHDGLTLERTRRLLDGALAERLRQRRALGIVCGVTLPAIAVVFALLGDETAMRSGALLIGALGCVAGEIFERDLFFRSEAMRGMPGATAAPAERRRAA